MYKLLIVDDEVISRLGISHLLDWETYGFSLVESVGNGKEALEIMETIHIDLVITDVKMPIVDGIELMKEAKTRGLETKFILMSAYDDFQYVREGLTRGALDYILKCEMNQEHIVPLLEKATSLLAENQNFHGSMKRSEGTIKEARRSVLKRLLFGRFEGNVQAQHMCEEVQILLDQGTFCVISFQLTGALAKQSARVVGFIGDILQDYPQSYICETMLNEMTILCNPKPEEKKEAMLEELEARLVFFVKQYFNSGIKLLVSPWVDSVDQIPKCYLQAHGLKGYCALVNENKMIRYDEVQKWLVEDNATWMYDWKHKFQKTLEKSEDVIPILDALICGMDQVSYLDVVEYGNLLTSMVRLLEDDVWNWKDKGQVLAGVDQIDSKEAAIEKLQLLKQGITRNENNNNYIVRMAKQYVEKHYTEGIKIKEVAEQVGVSNSYLSSLFHQVAGVTLKEYSQQLQFKKAKQLLRETNETVSEIAYQVGYENEQQFSRVFKQRVGSSPTSYRNGRV